MKIPANQLSAKLRNSLLPCYLVTGDEPLLLQEALDAIRAAARERGFGSRELMVADVGFDWSEFAAAGRNLSLFAERRIIELRLPTGKPGRVGAGALCDMAARAGDELLLIVGAPKLERRNHSAKWVKTLAAAGALVQVWPVERRELPRWIEARMRAFGLEPERDAVRLVADRVEGNLLAAQQEIDKLRLSLGRGAVTAEHVQQAVADSSRFDVYKLVDAALGGDAQRAVRILGRLRAEGLEPPLVLWALTRELRVLARLAEQVEAGSDLSAALRRCRVWERRQDLVRACVARHRLGDFYRMLGMLRDADAAAKGQLAADPWQLGTELVLQLSGRQANAA